MKKRILIMINSATGGGAEKVLLNILKSLKNDDKYEIDLFLIEESGIYLEEFKKYSNSISFLFSKYYIYNFQNRICKFFYFIYKRVVMKLFCFQLVKKINSNYDTEISFLEGITGEYIGRRKNNSYKIGWIHTDLKKFKIPFWIKRKAYKNYNKVICVSKDSKNSFLELYPEYANITEVIYNPILREEIIKKSKEKVDDLDLDKLNIVSIGRLVEQKEYLFLLEVHKELLKEGLNYNLIILGEGPLRKEIESYIKKNFLENNTKLLGFKKNPYPYIKKSDIFVISSSCEGYSLVLAEALILEKPIISTKCMGPIELLNNGEYGVLVDIKDKLALKNELKNMIENKKQRTKYIELSRKRSELFKVNQIIEQIKNLFDLER